MQTSPSRATPQELVDLDVLQRIASFCNDEWYKERQVTGESPTARALFVTGKDYEERATRFAHHLGEPCQDYFCRACREMVREELAS